MAFRFLSGVTRTVGLQGILGYFKADARVVRKGNDYEPGEDPFTGPYFCHYEAASQEKEKMKGMILNAVTRAKVITASACCGMLGR